MASRDQIGLLGLGKMGLSIATRLKKTGARVYGYDINEGARRSATRAGVDCLDPADLAGLPLVLSSLPDDQAVRQALLPPPGLLGQMTRGSMLIDLSTLLPETMRAVAAGGSDHEVHVLDGAVSGGPAEAAAGTLVVLVGGPASDFRAARHVLDRLGTVQHAGGIGAAKTVKLVNNVMTMGNVLVAAEAFVLGTKAGMDPEHLFMLLSTSGGRSHHFLKRFPLVLQRDFRARFSLTLGEKDLRLALTLAQTLGAPMPATALIHQLYQSAIGVESGDLDIVAIVKLYERLAGIAPR